MQDVPEISHDAPEAPAKRMLVGEQLPKAMGPIDMMRAFNISETTFYRMQRKEKFKPFLLPRAIAGKKYSGEAVQRFLNGRK